MGSVRQHRRSPFSQSDVTRAFRGAQAAGVNAAVVIQADGSMAIIPASSPMAPQATNDLDALIDAFGAR